MWIDSKLGEGTRTGIEIPEVQVAAEVAQEVPAGQAEPESFAKDCDVTGATGTASCK